MTKPFFVDVVYSAAEISRRTGLTASAIYYARKRGDLPPIELGGGRYGYLGESVERWLESRRYGAPRPEPEAKVAVDDDGLVCRHCRTVLALPSVPDGAGGFCGWCVAEGRGGA